MTQIIGAPALLAEPGPALVGVPSAAASGIAATAACRAATVHPFGIGCTLAAARCSALRQSLG